MDSHDIKSLRRRLGMTQKELAEEMAVESNTVARWERGELRISAPMAKRLTEVAESLGSSSAVTQSSAVAIDPYHQDILDGLRRRLDPEMFEACAVALLRREWPTLVPISGGGDDGFDGAIDSAAPGTSFPLVVTTAERVVRNFGNNVDRAISEGWNPTSVLFATSRHVTPRTRRKLCDEAGHRHVDLRHVYDQSWFALRLYEEPDWCNRLLGLTGRPRALSLFPSTQRPVLGDTVLGREREMQWLMENRGDCMVVGEPGSGKTFVLRALALQRAVRFLVDDDRTQIANDLRRLTPEGVIVDDAHVDPDRIARLRQIRHELDAEFRIIATSWPGGAERVGAVLSVASERVLELKRIDADVMVKIIQSVGIDGPDELLIAIRRQAAGRPGLAATLAHLCLIGELKDVVSGEALMATLSNVLDHEAARLLAPFAIGGDAGVQPVSVARLLNDSLLHVSGALAELSMAGVVRERQDSAVSVEPEPMRWILVKQVFGGGVGSIEIDPVLTIAEDRHDALHTLIGARSRGAAIPELERWLEDANNGELWSAYASSGAAQARYVLNQHPELIDQVADPALLNAPETAIPMLLDRLGDEHRSFGEPMTNPMDRLKKWANGFSVYQEPALERRITLLRETANWWEQKRDGDRAIKAMCVAVAPGFDYSALDPGMGNTVTFVSGMLRDTDLRGLMSKWPLVLQVVRGSEHVPWAELFGLIEDWLHPDGRLFPPARVSGETRGLLQDFAGTMVRDLAGASLEHPGVQHRIGELAVKARVSVELNPDPEFDRLFPSGLYDGEDWERQHQRWIDEVDQLAARLTYRSLEEIVSVVARFHREAYLAGMHHLRLSHLCTKLAERMSSPARVAEALMDHELPNPLVMPFADRAAAVDDPNWIRLAQRCLNEPEYRWSMVQAVLTHRAPPVDTHSLALSLAPDMPMLEEFLSTRCRGLSESTTRELLRSNDVRVAVAIAVGLWRGRRVESHAADDELWRRAFLRSALEIPGGIDSAHRVEEILTKDGDLAVEWLVCNLSVRYSPHISTWRVAERVASALDVERRAKVLERLANSDEASPTERVIRHLIGEEMELYGQLLDCSSLADHHLDPLCRNLDDTWRRMALLARGQGYGEREITQATIGHHWSWTGSESEMWERRRAAFEAVMDDVDCRVVRIGQEGVNEMSERKQTAMRREEEAAVEGPEAMRRRTRR